jgi:hypothetical protein
MRRGLPWIGLVLAAAFVAALVVVIVLQRSTASDRDRLADGLSASRDALARKTAKLQQLRADLRRAQLALGAPRRALLHDRRFQIAFVRGPYRRGTAIVVASADGRIEHALVDVDDLQAEIFRRRTPINSVEASCRRGLAFSIRTDWGVADLFETGELRGSADEGPCPPTSHGGTTLVFGGTVYARYGKTEKKLFTTEGVGNTNRDWVTLSPDGKRVVFELWVNVEPPSYGVQIMNTHTRQQLSLGASLPAFWTKENFAWSPDGQRIAMTLRPLPKSEDVFGDLPKPPSWLVGAKEGIAIIDRRGHSLARIPNGADAVWSPDGQTIVFDSNRSGRRQVYIANADGSGVRQVTHASEGSWSPIWR